MRLGGRIAAAIEILEDIEARHRPAADALKDWGLSHRFAGSGDRAAIGNLVHDALRHKRTASALLGVESARAGVVGALLLSRTETVESLDQAMSGDRFAPERLSGAERDVISRFDPSNLADAVRADVPDWIAEPLRSAFGDDWVEESAALSARPPLDLRVNTLKASREKVLSALRRAKAAPCALSPDGVRIPPTTGHGRHPNVRAEPAFQKGWFEVQDEGSQIVTRVAASQTGQQILDYCAGAGGKTLALSALLENRGQIFAHDADKQRLAPIFDRLRRAGCRNVQVMPESPTLEQFERRMDLVLVDAPCSGSGTWRRRPDAKWRLTPQQLEARQTEQDSILEAASRYARPAGRLAYVTCSVFPPENEDRITRFLDRHPHFEIVDPQQLIEDALPGQAHRFHLQPSGIALTPLRTGTDGFFLSALRRVT